MNYALDKMTTRENRNTSPKMLNFSSLPPSSWGPKLGYCGQADCVPLLFLRDKMTSRSFTTQPPSTYISNICLPILTSKKKETPIIRSISEQRAVVAGSCPAKCCFLSKLVTSSPALNSFHNSEHLPEALYFEYGRLIVYSLVVNGDLVSAFLKSTRYKTTGLPAICIALSSCTHARRTFYRLRETSTV